MNWLNKLERKFGHLAIHNLIHYIIGLNIFVYIAAQLVGWGNVTSRLMLDPSLIMKGEVWRLFTYIAIPPATSPLWIIFTLYFYYLIGSALEHEWGSFKFNIYYFTGMLATTLAAFLSGGEATAVYLNLSLFLAFARLYPDFQILLFFILPVKIKYLAWFDLAYIVYTVLVDPPAYKIMAVVSLLNFLLFFGKDILSNTKNSRKVYYNRRNFRSNIPKDITIHRCTVCGKTEKDDPNLEFRYCQSCEGGAEYCMEHLKDHEHIKANNA